MSRRENAAARSRLRRRLLIAIVLVALAAYFGPGLAGRWFPQWIVAQLVPELADRLTVESLTLSWGRVVEAEGVRLLDDQGDVVAEVPRITTEYSLAYWLNRPSQLGEIALESPELSLSWDGHELNVERAIRPLLERQAGEPLDSWSIAVHDGKVKCSNSLTGRTVQCQAVEAKFTWQSAPAANKPPATLQLEGMAVDDASAEWPIALTASGESQGPRATLGGVRWNADIRSFPTALAEVALPADVRLSGSLEASLVLDAETVQWRKLKWSGPGGSLASDGVVPFRLLGQPRPWASYLGPLSIQFDLDLPTTWQGLRTLVPDAPTGAFEQGHLKGEVTWSEENAEPSIVGEIHADRVVTRVDDRRTDWQMPLDVAWNFGMAHGLLEIRKLRATAPFVDATIAGSLRNATIDGTADLESFQQLVGEVVLPRSVTAAGSVSFTGAWQQQDASWEGRLQWEGSGLEIAWSDDGRISETLADGSLSWECQQLGDGKLEIRAADARVSAGTDAVQATLRQATTWQGADTHWPLEVRAEGSLLRWSKRLSPWISPGANETHLPRGAFQASAIVVLLPDRVEIIRADGAGSELRWAPYGRWWVEPAWRIHVDNGHAQWNGTLSAGRVILQSTTVAASVSEWTCPDVTDVASWSGNVSLRGDLTRIQEVVRVWHAQPWPVRLSGEIVAKLMAVQEAGEPPRWEGVWTARSLRVDSYESMGSERDWFQTPELTGALHVAWDDGTVLLRQFDVELPQALTAKLQGKWQLNSEQRPFSVSGEVSYDWEALRRSWPTPWPLEVRGRGTQPIQVTGEFPTSGTMLDSIRRDWTGSLSLAWDGISAWGLEIGPGRTNVAWQRGMLTADRVETTVGSGTLSVRPWVDWRSTTAHLRLDPPAQLHDLRLSPEMCRGWLQYAIPLLAQATTAQGQFSAEVAEFDWPIGARDRARAQGSLIITGGRVGPSEEVRKMLAVLDIAAKLNGRGGVNPNQVRWLELPRQTVPVKLERARVYHDTLRVRLGEMELASRGSVGLDQTLDVALAMRIPDKWVTGQPLLASLRGQTLVFPLQGTLDQPKLSSDALKAITDRLIQGSAEQLLRNGLRGLFGNGN